MLRRCLKSLLAQSYREWVALVIDDSPEREGEEISSEFNEDRICYRPNPTNLGCSANLDQAFSNTPFADADFACVLEDDNWLLPHFLSVNIDALEYSGCRIVLRNQIVAIEGDNRFAEQCNQTTRGKVFGNTNRRLSPLEIRAAMFFSEGISNGGLFWKLSENISLAVGPNVRFSPMQEYCRSLLISEDVWFGAEPLAVFSLPYNGVTTREPLANRRFNRGRQSILSRILNHHGTRLVDIAKKICTLNNREVRELAISLADTGWGYMPVGNISYSELLKFRLKGIAKRCLISDPLNEYWAAEGEKVIRSLESL